MNEFSCTVPVVQGHFANRLLGVRKVHHRHDLLIILSIPHCTRVRTTVRYRHHYDPRATNSLFSDGNASAGL